MFAEAWIAYGHCYARLEEGEQALAAYRRAENLFPGLRQCELYLGIQYARQHAAQLALTCLESAQRARATALATKWSSQNSSNAMSRTANATNDDENALHSNSVPGAAPICPPSAPRAFPSTTSSFDALLLNETAVLHFRSRQYASALQLLMRAREALPNKERPADHEVCVLFNLASAFRKVQYYDLAAATYLEFIRLRPQAAVGH